MHASKNGVVVEITPDTPPVRRAYQQSGWELLEDKPTTTAATKTTKKTAAKKTAAGE